mgnify:CR=1 FL=1
MIKPSIQEIAEALAFVVGPCSRCDRKLDMAARIESFAAVLAELLPAAEQLLQRIEWERDVVKSGGKSGSVADLSSSIFVAAQRAALDLTVERLGSLVRHDATEA